MCVHAQGPEAARIWRASAPYPTPPPGVKERPTMSYGNLTFTPSESSNYSKHGFSWPKAGVTPGPPTPDQ